MLSVVIHGGAGRLVRENADRKLPYLKEALDAAWSTLLKGAPGEDAVVAALRVMEGSEYFNAGYGGYPNSKGIVLLDVGLMNGSREFASFINVRRLKYPSEVARDYLRTHQSILSTWTHEMMQEVDRAPPEIKNRYGWVENHEALIAPFVRSLMEHAELGREQPPSPSGKKEGSPGTGTVGCVVRDASGRICAGTSTGGVSFKANGRVGDTPIIGSGVFADDEIGGLSTSGHGEAILLSGLSGFIIARLRSFFAASRPDEEISATALDTLLKAELKEFERKAPGKGVGIIVIPRRGPATYAHHSPMFSIALREGTPSSVTRDEVKISTTGT
jgi:beta-aspartyl-peptidase (threonine type)